jgi:hypothetical protein
MALGHGLDAALPTWDAVRAQIQFSGILVGNGASRAVWPAFGYDSLYNVALATAHPLTPADVALFDAFGTHNFEQVLAALATARRVTTALDLHTQALVERYASVRTSLVEAVHATHVPWPAVPAATLQAIRGELLNYDFVYSTNYDLLIYWAVMHGNEDDFKDFFWAPPYFDLANAEVWGEPTMVLYVHGGLHLYRNANGRTLKRHAEEGQNLLALFGMPIEGEDATPLFVSEGSAGDKLASISRSDYLTFAYTALVQHEGPLCVFGHSLGETDNHIVQALAARPRQIAISILPGAPAGVIATKAATIQKLPDANLSFYDATTHPLGAPGLAIGAPVGH